MFHHSQVKRTSSSEYGLKWRIFDGAFKLIKSPRLRRKQENCWQAKRKNWEQSSERYYGIYIGLICIMRSGLTFGQGPSNIVFLGKILYSNSFMPTWLFCDNFGCLFGEIGSGELFLLVGHFFWQKLAISQIWIFLGWQLC